MNKKNNSLTALLAPVFCLVLAGCFGGRMASSGRGGEVVGVSVDSAKSHQRFIEKNSLPFTLIADTDKKLVEEFGVWGEKKMYGKTYMGTLRTTFIIDENGVVEQVMGPKEIKVKEHAAQILNR